MLPQEFFSNDVQRFIRDLEDELPETIVLKNKTIAGLSASFIADQVHGRKKAKEKIPVYYANPFVAYPPKVNLEQSSSETTAEYKLELIRSSRVKSFNSCVDLTGGFGVDSYFLSTLFDSVTYVEPNEALLEIAASNHQQLGRSNIRHVNANALGFLTATQQQCDLIFIDPSRRVSGNQKVHSFSQSEPNVTGLLDLLLTKSDIILIKASPLLDIRLALKELGFVYRVDVVAVSNDCKELLFLVTKEKTDTPQIHTINFRNNGREIFDFDLKKEQETETVFSDVSDYLYEPNAAIMKAGAFKSIAQRFGLSKIHQNTHLYTSDKHLSDFPGRTFKIVALVKPDPAELRKYFPDGQGNVITRNYPLSVDQLRKKIKLTEGGERYVLAFSGTTKKIVAVADRRD